MAATRPLTVELVWQREVTFAATSERASLVVDGDSTAGPSPVQLLAMGLASCMAIDLLDIVRKGRHQVEACRVSLRGERAEVPPRRLLAVTLHFELRGDVAPHTVERALALSRDKYCSVWHSMRQDITLETTFAVSN
jgi:putative redox protein